MTKFFQCAKRHSRAELALYEGNVIPDTSTPYSLLSHVFFYQCSTVWN